MNNVIRYVALLLLMLAVAGYTIFNYVTGKTDLTMMVVSLAIICIPMVNMLNILIQQWKNRD